MPQEAQGEREETINKLDKHIHENEKKDSFWTKFL